MIISKEDALNILTKNKSAFLGFVADENLQTVKKLIHSVEPRLNKYFTKNAEKPKFNYPILKYTKHSVNYDIITWAIIDDDNNNIIYLCGKNYTGAYYIRQKKDI